MPLNLSADANHVYSTLLKEFSQANEAMVDDMSDDGVLNGEETVQQLMDSLEQHFIALQHLEKNRKKG